MLVDIQKMPPAFGVPSDRRLHVYTGPQLESHVLSPYVYWPSVPLYHNKLSVGSLINQAPTNLYKAVHTSTDGLWIFESVFSTETDIGNKPLWLNLYTKIISNTSSNIAISLRSVEFYQDSKGSLSTLTNLIAPLHRNYENMYTTALAFTSTASDLIVPPLLDEKSLWTMIDRITDIRSRGISPDQFGLVYKPLYDHEPRLFEALMQGNFSRSPFYDLPGYHPSLMIHQDRWFLYEEVRNHSEARGFDVKINHPGFDVLALEMVNLFAGKISLQCLMTHAIDGLKDIWLTKNYHNPYHYYFQHSSSTHFFSQRLESIFYQSVMTYCRIYSIDSDMFLDGVSLRSSETSSITITKNHYDEVVFTFHDTLNHRYVSFYSSFPTLMLSTLAVGSY